MRRGNGLNNLLKQRTQITRFILQLFLGNSLSRNCIKNRKLDLLIRGIEIQEQFIDLVHNFGGPCIVAIDFVNYGNRGEPGFKGFTEYETRLRQATFGSVDE